MKHLFFILLFPFLVFLSYAQTKSHTPPDFKKIESNITDKASGYYYPSLIKRYKDNDTTLNEEEYLHLYYGFSFQKEYEPYGRSDHRKEVSELLGKKEIGGSDVDKIIKIEKAILERFPFNLSDMYTMIRMLEKKNDTTAAEKMRRKLIGIGKAIMSTGDGRSDTTAMYVISVDHEYDLVSLLGFSYGGRQSLVHSKQGETDRLQLEKNDDGFEALYFNVDRLFAKMGDLFKEK